jgi:hypothetical protein
LINYYNKQSKAKKPRIMDEIIETTSKFTLCVLSTQQGKTFTAISKIISEIEHDREFGRSIHIIFTMNTLMNNEQFAKRLETVEKDYGRGSVCVFSSKYDGNYKHVKTRIELQGICLDNSTIPRVIIMCSNSCRFEDGVEFLNVINNNRINIVRSFAYYDELHKYINDERRIQIERIHSFNIISGIMALTATPDKIFQNAGFWNKIRLINIPNFSEENYAGYKDMVFNINDEFFKMPYVSPRQFSEDMDNQTIGFIEHILNKYPEILEKNARLFAPAHIPRKGHNRVRDLIFKQNKEAVVIVINGVEKTMQFNDSFGNTKTLPLYCDECEEVCETISRLLIKHDLVSRPMVITGYMCIGMGQTLVNEQIGSFTSAIIGHLDLTNDDIYQLFGRITGRMKHWSTYVPTQVYCPTPAMNRIIVMEECSRNMACGHNGNIVDRGDYRGPMNIMGDVGKDAVENIRPDKTKKKTKTNIKDPSDTKSIPIVVSVSKEEFGKITKSGHAWNIESILEIIKKYSNDTYDTIKTMEKNQIVQPNADLSYNKMITAFVKASENNTKYTWAIGKNKHKDTYQVYLDNRSFRIVVSIYYGSRIIVS